MLSHFLLFLLILELWNFGTMILNEIVPYFSLAGAQSSKSRFLSPLGQLMAQESIDSFLMDIYGNYFIQTLLDSIRFIDASDRMRILSKIVDFQRVCQDTKGTHVI